MTADMPAPRPLTVEEIKEYVQLYVQAVKNAVHGAGFDGKYTLSLTSKI